MLNPERIEDPELTERMARSEDSERAQASQDGKGAEEERAAHLETWEQAADISNEQRPFWKKLFSKDETSAMDVAMNEARLIDQSIDYLVDQRGLSRAEAEAEVLRQFDDPAVERAVSQPELMEQGKQLGEKYVAGDFQALWELRRWPRPIAEQQMMIEGARPVVLEEIMKKLHGPQKNIGAVATKLAEFEIRRSDIPEENLDEVQAGAREWLEQIASIPTVFRYELHRLEANGIIERQEDFLHKPETQAAIESGLRHACEWGDPKDISASAELLRESQSGSGEPVEVTLSSRDFDLIAKHLSEFPKPVEAFFTELVQAQVTTPEQEPLFQGKVKERSVKVILKNLAGMKKHSYGGFNQKSVDYITEKYMSSGIITKEEILEHPEVAKMLAA